MPISFRNITALSLALMVWTSTIGFNMHLLYCFCKEEWKVSLFEPDDTCTALKETNSKPCCSKNKGCSVNTDPTEFQKTPCESTSVQFVKISDKFLPSKDVSTDILPDFTAILSQLAISAIFVSAQDLSPSDHNKAPPLPYGRTLLTFLQLMLC